MIDMNDMNDSIILKQEWSDVSINCFTGSVCQRFFRYDSQDLSPRWIYVPPTVEMQRRGLSEDLLRDLVDAINRNSYRFICRELKRRPLPPHNMAASLLIIVCGIVLLFTRTFIGPWIKWWYPGILVVTGVFVGLSVLCFRKCISSKAYSTLFKNVKQVLNKELSPYGVRVKIRRKLTTIGGFEKWWHDLEIISKPKRNYVDADWKQVMSMSIEKKVDQNHQMRIGKEGEQNLVDFEQSEDFVEYAYSKDKVAQVAPEANLAEGEPQNMNSFGEEGMLYEGRADIADYSLSERNLHLPFEPGQR